MNPESTIFGRRSIRMRGYDYSLAGAYFVTVCTQNRLCLFGNVNNEQMTLNQAGQMVYEQWLDLPKRFPESAIDEFTMMPNHLHGILIINDNETTQFVGWLSRGLWRRLGSRCPPRGPGRLRLVPNRRPLGP